VPAATDSVWVNMIDSVTVFEYELIDFGEVKEGELVYGRFAFTNFANQPLEIDLVSTCQCIEAEWSQGPIQTGQAAEILLKLNTKGEGPEFFKTIDLIFKNEDERGYPYVKQVYMKGQIK
jgi:hypothetical protein